MPPPRPRSDIPAALDRLESRPVSQPPDLSQRCTQYEGLRRISEDGAKPSISRWGSDFSSTYAHRGVEGKLTKPKATTNHMIEAAHKTTAAVGQEDQKLYDDQPSLDINQAATKSDIDKQDPIDTRSLALYRDLTGLEIVTVEQRDRHVVFTCFQTGRNGELHFHLSVPSGEVRPVIDEVTYRPILEKSQGLDLSSLPIQLRNPTTFNGKHIAKFYNVIFKALTERVFNEP